MSRTQMVRVTLITATLGVFGAAAAQADTIVLRGGDTEWSAAAGPAAVALSAPDDDARNPIDIVDANDPSHHGFAGEFVVPSVQFPASGPFTVLAALQFPGNSAFGVSHKLLNDAASSNGLRLGRHSSDPGSAPMMPTPEPASMLLVGVGIAGAAIVRGRRGK